MNALELLLAMGERGVEFWLVDDEVRFDDHGRPITGDERSLLRALKPQIRALLIQLLPQRRAEHACDGFDAAPGAALCERCAYGLGDHFWRRCGDCTFFTGAASEATCRRCGVPRLEHLTGAPGRKTEA